jgi:hypothetical protein
MKSFPNYSVFLVQKRLRQFRIRTHSGETKKVRIRPEPDPLLQYSQCFWLVLILFVAWLVKIMSAEIYTTSTAKWKWKRGLTNFKYFLIFVLFCTAWFGSRPYFSLRFVYELTANHSKKLNGLKYFVMRITNFLKNYGHSRQESGFCRQGKFKEIGPKKIKQFFSSMASMKDVQTPKETQALLGFHQNKNILYLWLRSKGRSGLPWSGFRIPDSDPLIQWNPDAQKSRYSLVPWVLQSELL